MAPNPHPLAHCPFSYRSLKDGRVQIFHNQRTAKTLKAVAAEKFLDAIESADEIGRQLIMARITGQFKFGNEDLKKS